MKGRSANLACAYPAPEAAWPPAEAPAAADRLVPVTADASRTVLLLAGLWQDPTVARLLSGPQRRVRVQCRYRAEGRAENVQVRWQRDQPWMDVEPPVVGRVLSCRQVR